MRLHYANVAANPAAADAPADLLDDMLALAFERAFLDDAWSIRDQAAFERCRAQGRSRLGPALLEISASTIYRKRQAWARDG